MTRLDAAIHALKAAAGDRSFVLMIQKAHRNADRGSFHVHQADHMQGYEGIGMAEHGVRVMKAAVYGSDGCDEEAAG